MQAIVFRHICEDVGKKIKRTKKKYQWDFGFEIRDDDIERHEVVLYYSVISGKRQLFLDGQKISTSSGQFGKYEMKFNIDQHKNMARIEAYADKSKLFINNIEFQEINSQYRQHGLSNKNNDVYIQDGNLSDSDPEDIDEDTLNRINLEKERYNNVVSKIKGPNPQIFNGPIYKNQENNKQPENQFKGVFQSFGQDSKIQNTQQQNNSNQNQLNGIKQQNQSNIKNENIQPNPFSGFNFSSWVQNEQPQKSGSQVYNSQPQQQGNFNRSQSLSTAQQSNQSAQTYIKDECPFFGQNSSMFQQIHKSHSVEQSQANNSKVFEDFFKTDNNCVDQNRLTFQFNGQNNNINSFNEGLNRNNQSRSDSNFMQINMSYNNSQATNFNINSNINQQNQSPSFTSSQQQNNQYNKFNIQTVPNQQQKQIYQSSIDLL
ncbi:hypothetical protein TTHERM_01298550 (macronuclear) [Tetrahymena thermophila SB210]|uniref:Uncharacterized protein n=1 Tax=Tetrahymena thermophila (strain SB210) TaxID=312017 RepID=Q22A10_TETTS|nr:hypothetical protein TTHERM_01298550 [Tetrahymena thermophila SB210]EAR82132.1 hypothetical protein TTHERM_01298550 [Tetrahymena thermophila SB210]|eukprot:XP_001029795.1 hypothetical protein TTHERM_01298550 [Tetrahymena thermophila SB210]